MYFHIIRVVWLVVWVKSGLYFSFCKSTETLYGVSKTFIAVDITFQEILY